ncbi:hypothetical protein BD410DRAFT_798627 [Rickenella mellea]|uniref:Uncharacterized protein n=1 Tax=Rickenella mellea TaxID=50990 RepID=A0A4Y7QN18_9AGAM|nr:hypothetical protein BD410DRAFT_798627 [Rickenella mellea]
MDPQKNFPRIYTHKIPGYPGLVLSTTSIESLPEVQPLVTAPSVPSLIEDDLDPDQAQQDADQYLQIPVRYPDPSPLRPLILSERILARRSSSAPPVTHVTEPLPLTRPPLPAIPPPVVPAPDVPPVAPPPTVAAVPPPAVNALPAPPPPFVAPPAIMAAPPPIPMLAPSRPEAPYFSGADLQLNEFLDEYESLAAQAHLTPEEQCKRLYKYAEPSHGELWKDLPARTAAPTVWADYRSAIEALYPGSNSSRRFTPSELRAFVSDQHANYVMETIDDLGDYHRKFTRRASPLTANQRLPDADKNELYFAGFPRRFQTKLKQRLLIQHPDHDEGDAFPMAEVYAAAGHILANTHSVATALPRPTRQQSRPRRDERDLDNGSDSDSSSERHHSGQSQRTKNSRRRENPERELAAPATPATTPSPSNYLQVKLATSGQSAPVKQESPDFDNLLATLTAHVTSQIDSLGRQLANSLTLKNAPSSAPRQSPSRPQSPIDHTSCLFCMDPSHMMRECPTAQEYIRAGKVIKDARNRTLKFNFNDFLNDAEEFNAWREVAGHDYVLYYIQLYNMGSISIRLLGVELLGIGELAPPRPNTVFVERGVRDELKGSWIRASCWMVRWTCSSTSPNVVPLSTPFGPIHIHPQSPFPVSPLLPIEHPNVATAQLAGPAAPAEPSTHHRSLQPRQDPYLRSEARMSAVALVLVINGPDLCAFVPASPRTLPMPSSSVRRPGFKPSIRRRHLCSSKQRRTPSRAFPCSHPHVHVHVPADLQTITTPSPSNQREHISALLVDLPRYILTSLGPPPPPPTPDIDDYGLDDKSNPIQSMTGSRPFRVPESMARDLCRQRRSGDVSGSAS